MPSCQTTIEEPSLVFQYCSMLSMVNDAKLYHQVVPLTSKKRNVTRQQKEKLTELNQI